MQAALRHVASQPPPPVAAIIQGNHEEDDSVSKSMQDQLRQAGLASKKQEVSARKAKNTREKMQRKGQDVVNEAADLARQAQIEKVARDRELNRARAAEAERHAIAAQVKELVTLNRISERGEIEFRFTEGSAIRTLMVEEQQRRALVNGKLAIVALADRHEIVPRKVAEKVAERDAEAVVLMNARSAAAPSDDDEPDEYAGYEVPDDLMW